tara:strand:- start:750 stop:2102 length:1353 start_codon:yes stop_codon:yes gene_type:complete
VIHVAHAALLLLLLVTPFMFSYILEFLFSASTTTDFFEPKKFFVWVVAPLFIAAAAMDWVSRVRRIMLPSRLSIAAVLIACCLAAWSFVTVASAQFPLVALQRSIVLAGMIALVFAMRYVLQREAWRRRYVNVIIFAAAVTAIYAVLQFIYGYDPISRMVLPHAGQVGGAHAAGALFGTPWVVAVFLGISFFLTLGYFSRLCSAERSWLAMAVGLCSVIILLAIAATNNRTTELALVYGFAALIPQGLALLYRQVRLLRVFILLQGAGLVAVALVTVWMSLAALPEAAARRWDAQLSGRLFAWRVAGRMAADRPLSGVGLGGYEGGYLQGRVQLLAQPTAPFNYHRLGMFSWEAAHNEYLQILAELGVPGFVLFVLLVLAVSGIAGRRFALEGGGKGGIGEQFARLLEVQAWMAAMCTALASHVFQMAPLALMAAFTTALVVLGRPESTP